MRTLVDVTVGTSWQPIEPDVRPLFDGPATWKGSPARVLVYGPLTDGLLDVVFAKLTPPKKVKRTRRSDGKQVEVLEGPPPEVLFVGCYRPSDRFVSLPWKVCGTRLAWSKDKVLDAIVVRVLAEFRAEGA